jgi:hypothetical protein
MADGNNQDFAFQLPDQFPAVGEVFQSMINRKEKQQERADSLAERQRQFNERQADRDLSNQYKNAQLIKEGTDLSNYMTGDAIANDTATKYISELLPNFVQMSKSGANPVDLQMAMSKAVNNVVPALSNIKRELTLGDDALKKLSELYPDLDKESFIKKYREDVHNRTIDKETGKLKPAQLVEASEFQNNLTNPDFLSTFVRGNKNLVESITNPKGTDQSSVLAGSPDSYVKYETKVPFWKKPSYTNEQVKEGFLDKKIVPELVLKSSVLPMDKIDSKISENKPFNIIDKEVYNRFEEDPKSNLELIASARAEYPQYDKFNSTEKEYIKRHVLYNKINELDQNQFHPTQSTKPSKVTITNPKEDKIGIAIEANTGILKENFDNAIENNPRVVVVPTKQGGNIYQTWGELGQNDLTKPFKATVDIVTKDAQGNQKVSTKTVPYDKYFVTPENKIYGAYYVRDANGAMTAKIGVQKEIPIRQYTEILVSKTTSPTNRKQVVDSNINEVLGESNNKNQRTTAPKQSSEYSNVTETNKGTIGVKNGKWYDVKTGKPI